MSHGGCRGVRDSWGVIGGEVVVKQWAGKEAVVVVFGVVSEGGKKKKKEWV